MKEYELIIDGVVELPTGVSSSRVTADLAAAIADVVEGYDGRFGGAVTITPKEAGDEAEAREK